MASSRSDAGRGFILRSSTDRASVSCRSRSSNKKKSRSRRTALILRFSALLAAGCLQLLGLAVRGGAPADRDLHRLRLGRLRLGDRQDQHAVEKLCLGLIAQRILRKRYLAAELPIKVLAQPVRLGLGLGRRLDLTLDVD